MVNFEEARKLVLQNCRSLPATRIPVLQSLGYVLAEPLRAPTPLPRFDASAVDGYAVRASDLGNASAINEVTLPLVDTLRAGDPRRMRLTKQSTMRILTGAQIPEGADALVMQEYIRVERNRVIFSKPVSPGDNIRFAGEEFSKGDIICERGTIVTPPVVSMLATIGRRHVRVHRKPRIALIVTGDELRSPGSGLTRGTIYDSNTPGLTASLHAVGIDAVKTFRAADNPKRIAQAFSRALSWADVVISSGGVSVGSSDFVKDVLAELGVQRIFWRVAIKPGKPIFFGRKGKTLLFGLPGNPVAALLGFQLLIKPALLVIMGSERHRPVILPANLTHDLKKKTGRAEFVRGLLSHDSDGRLNVTPTRGQDSHMVGGLAKADCLIHFPKNLDRLSAGNSVHVFLLNWWIS